MQHAFRTAMMVAAFALAGSAAPAHAQPTGSYPSKPIRLIAPEVPGSAIDVLARPLAQRLGEALGQPVVVDNIFGAPGIEAAVKAPADGYTLVYGSDGPLALLPHVKKVSYDPMNDLMPVSLCVINPTLLAVTPSVPAATMKDLIALMKAKPDQLKLASAGAGTASHLAAVMFGKMAGVNVVPVYYDGGGPAIAAVLNNDAQWMFAPIAGRLPYVRAGKLKAIATGGTDRLSVLPDVPTAAEAGLPGFKAIGWGGILAPKGTPQPIIDKLNATIAKMLALPQVKEQLAEQGSQTATGTPGQFASLIREDFDRLGALAKVAGIEAK